MNVDLLMSFGRMFPDCSLPTTVETLQAFSWRWETSGITEHGQCLMLNSLALHSADAAYSVCSLAEILEQDVAQKYYLSPRACRGILSRAERRGKSLPTHLRRALEAASLEAEDKDRTP